MATELLTYSHQDIDLPEKRKSETTSLRAVVPEEIKISDQQLDAFRRSFIALEESDAKASVLLFGIPNNRLTNLDGIVSGFQEKFAGSDWIPTEATIRLAYLNRSFCPNGIADEVKNGRNTYYKPTPMGQELTKKIAAAQLKYTDKYGLSLGKVLNGSTNKIAVLLSLNSGDITQADVAKKAGLSRPAVFKVIKVLKEARLVAYESEDQRSVNVLYKISGDPENLAKHATSRLRKNIIDYFSKNPFGNIPTFVKLYGYADNGSVTDGFKELLKEGVLKRADGLILTPNGTALVHELLLPALRAFAGEYEAFVELGQRQREVEENPDVAARAMDIYKEAAQKIPAHETAELIISQIALGPVRSSVLISSIGGHAEPILRQLAADGRIQKIQRGKACYYTLPGVEVEIPDEKKPETIIFDHKAPDTVLPLPGRTKEEYLTDLEKVEFWQKLLEDLITIDPKTATESAFFDNFRAGNPDWRNGQHKMGKYYNLSRAIKGLKGEKPYDFIEGYTPASKGPELQAAVLAAKLAIKERLEESKSGKSWYEYLKDLHTWFFWKQLLNDVRACPNGLTLGQFLLHFSREDPLNFSEETLGDYANLYEMARIHAGNGMDFVLSFSPSFPHEQTLNNLIAKAKKEVRNKFKAGRRNKVEVLPSVEELKSEGYLLSKYLDPMSLTIKVINALFNQGLTKYPYSCYRSLGGTSFIKSNCKFKGAIAENGAREIDALQVEKDGAYESMNDDIELYFRDIGRVPLMKAKEELELARGMELVKWQIEYAKDLNNVKLQTYAERKLRKIREEFTNANLKFVVYIAKKYQGAGISLKDLIQEGNIGLMKAVEKYNWRKGFRFATYSRWWIRNSIERGPVVDRAIRIPFHVLELHSKYKDAVQSLRDSFLRDPTSKEIARFLGWTVKFVEDLRQRMRRVISIHEKIGADGAEDDEFTLEQTLEASDNVEESGAETVLKDHINEVLSLLDAKERRVLIFRFGLEGGRSMTLEEVGQALGFTRARAKQIEAEALAKLRASGKAHHLKEFLN